MGDLRGLIEAVENGDRWDNNALYRLPGIENAVLAIGAFRGSLDAAKALHDALLPGCVWFIGHLDRIELGFVCTVSNEPFPDAPSFKGFADNPARAWLLAVLRALEAEGRG